MVKLRKLCRELVFSYIPVTEGNIILILLEGRALLKRMEHSWLEFERVVPKKLKSNFMFWDTLVMLEL
jgi:hypothetical protein